MSGRGTRPTGPRPWPTEAKRQCEMMVEQARAIQEMVEELLETKEGKTNPYLRQLRLTEIKAAALTIELKGTNALRDMKKDTPE